MSQRWLPLPLLKSPWPALKPPV